MSDVSYEVRLHYTKTNGDRDVIYLGYVQSLAAIKQGLMSAKGLALDRGGRSLRVEMTDRATGNVLFTGTPGMEQ